MGPDWLGPATDLLKEHSLDEAAEALTRQAKAEDPDEPLSLVGVLYQAGYFTRAQLPYVDTFLGLPRRQTPPPPPPRGGRIPGWLRRIRAAISARS